MQKLRNYGIVKMNFLKRTDLSVREKMIYVLIAVKQGSTDHAKISNRQIADALGISIQHVARTIKRLRNDLKLLKKEKEPYQISITNYTSKNKQYGVVEIDMLITTNLGLYAKYLYTIYCVVGNEFDTNIWSRDSICKQFVISKNKYFESHKELIKKGVLITKGAVKGNGIQTSNYNTICRAENFNIYKPDSWFKKEYEKVDLKSAGNNIKFRTVVDKPEETISKASRRYLNETGQPERTIEDKPDEQEKTYPENDIGQRILTNTTLTDIIEYKETSLTNRDPFAYYLTDGWATCYIEYYIDKKINERFVSVYDIEAQGFFDIIHGLAQEYAMRELNWTMSERDEEYLEKIIEYWNDIDRLPQIIGEGIIKCIEKDDWRFGQVIYRAHTVAVNYEMQGYAD